MSVTAKKITQIGTPEQTSEENQPENIWERQKNEPALWYMRFQIYLRLGKKRSLQAALEQEPRAPKGTKRHQGKLNDVSVLSVPGSWKRACKLWNWVERAQAYDLHTQGQMAHVMRLGAAHLDYSSRAYRIMELNTLAKVLKKSITPSTEIKDAIAIIARIQSIFHDIENEMAKLDMEDEADAEALMNIMKSAREDTLKILREK